MSNACLETGRIQQVARDRITPIGRGVKDRGEHGVPIFDEATPSGAHTPAFQAPQEELLAGAQQAFDLRRRKFIVGTLPCLPSSVIGFLVGHT